MKRKICSVLVIALIISIIAALPTFAVDLLYDGTNAELEAQGFVGITHEEELNKRHEKIYLKNDITLTNGVCGNMSDTIINGNGHTVYFTGGMSIINWGMNVQIENLNLAGDVTVDSGFFNQQGFTHYGPLSIHGIDGNLVVRNVHSSVNITVKDENVTGSIGGIMGKTHANSSTWENVTYTGTINTGTGDMTNSVDEMRTIGGITGLSGSNLSATNVFVDAEIIAGNKNLAAVGGLFGMTRGGNNVIENCEFNGSLTVSSELSGNCGVGGIFGSVKAGGNVSAQTAFIGVSNFGDIIADNARSFAPVGGIVGFANGDKGGISFNKVVNSGNIVGADVAGGITGKLVSTVAGTEDLWDGLSNIRYKAVKNAGEVKAVLTAGGIVGRAETNSIVAMTNIANTAKVVATDRECGKAAGILPQYISKLEKWLYISNVFNTGEISGAEATPIFDIYDKDLYENSGKAFYSNVLEGEHFGTKKTLAEIETMINEIDFVAVNRYYLISAVSSLKGNPKDYTDDSWKSAEDAVNSGKELLLVEDAKQEDINAAVERIKDAVAGLKYKPVDTTLLDKYIAEANLLNKDDYRGDTWRMLLRALEWENTDFVKQSEVDKATAELENALNGLVYKIDEDISLLIADLNRLKAKDYTAESWRALAEAKVIAEKATEYDEKVEAYNALLDAQKGLVDIRELNFLLSQIPKDRDNYTKDEDFWKALDQVTELANEVMENYDADQEYVDEVSAKLRNLIEELKVTESDIVDIVGTEKYSDMKDAWDNFISQKGTDSPFISQDDGASLNCQSSITAPVMIFTAVIVLGAGVTLKKKKD